MYRVVFIDEYDAEKTMVSRLLGIFRHKDNDPDCVEVRELSSDYIEEELDQESLDKIRNHISWCGPCNSFIRTLQATIDMLRNTPKAKAPSDFKERLYRRIHNSPQS